MLFLVLGPYTTHSYSHGEPPSRVGPVGSLSSAWSHCQPVVCEALPSAQLTPHRHLSWYTDRRISLNLGWVKEKHTMRHVYMYLLVVWGLGICTCIHMYTCTYCMNASVHSHEDEHACMHTYTCAHTLYTCMHMQCCVQTHTHTHARMHARRVQVHTYWYTFYNVHSQVYKYTHPHAHTHTYTHTHTHDLNFTFIDAMEQWWSKRTGHRQRSQSKSKTTAGGGGNQVLLYSSRQFSAHPKSSLARIEYESGAGRKENTLSLQPNQPSGPQNGWQLWE